MELLVQREPTIQDFTPGTLHVNGEEECVTLEDVVREITGQPVASWKIAGNTAIPAGRYRLVIDESKRFGKPMPHVLDVPGFDGIRIHIGNVAVDTEGCLLVGQVHTAAGIGASTAAFNTLVPKLQAALGGGEEVWITYLNPPAVTS